jgi:hypothetical protein
MNERLGSEEERLKEQQLGLDLKIQKSGDFPNIVNSIDQSAIPLKEFLKLSMGKSPQMLEIPEARMEDVTPSPNNTPNEEVEEGVID